MTRDEEKRWHEKHRRQEALAEVYERHIKCLPPFAHEKITWAGVSQEDKNNRRKHDIHKFFVGVGCENRLLVTFSAAGILIANATDIEPNTVLFIVTLSQRKVHTYTQKTIAKKGA